MVTRRSFRQASTGAGRSLTRRITHSRGPGNAVGGARRAGLGRQGGRRRG